MLRLSIYPCAGSADAERVGHQVDVAAVGRVVVVDVSRSGVAFQLQSGTWLAVKINGIALVEVKTKRLSLRLPAHTINLLREDSVGLGLVVTSQTKDAIRRAPGDCHDSRLMRPQIDLEGQLVGLQVAVDIVDLRGELLGTQRRRIFCNCACVCGRHDM